MSATPYIPSIAVDAVIDALAAFIQPFVGAAVIVRGRVNRVPPPTDPFVLLSEVTMVDIETPHHTSDTVNQQDSLETPQRIGVQVDFYGPSAGEQCAAVKSVYRSQYATAQFPSNIQPLYCSDGLLSPLITGEEQYDSRWILTAELQYNPIVVVPQQSATALDMNIVEDVA